VFILAGVCILIIPIHHAIKQNYGLSMIYTAKVRRDPRLNEDQLIALNNNATRERLGFWVFMVFYFASLALTAYRWVLAIDDMQVATINNVLYWATACSLLFLFINCLVCPGAGRSNKFAFLIRLILYPLMPFSRFADAGLRAAHGTEYLCVTAAILRNSAADFSRKREIMHLLLLLSAIGFVLLICSYEEFVAVVVSEENTALAIAARSLAYLGVALTFMHYYIDRRLYQFSKTLNREVIMPLLVR